MTAYRDRRLAGVYDAPAAATTAAAPKPNAQRKESAKVAKRGKKKT